MRPRREGGGKAAPYTDRIEARHRALETPAADQVDLLEEFMGEAALREAEGGTGAGFPSEELPELEDDLEPEMLGEDGEDYGRDPEDWTEPGDETFGALDAAEAEPDGRPHLAPPRPPHPDLLVTGRRDARGTWLLEVHLAGPAHWANWCVDPSRADTSAGTRAQRLLEALARREGYLLELGRLLLEKQRAYFEAVLEGVPPEEALLELLPLTQEDARQRLWPAEVSGAEAGLSKSSLSRLLTNAWLRVEAPGAPARSLKWFFAEADRGLRKDVLAAALRRLLARGVRDTAGLQREIACLCRRDGSRLALEPPQRQWVERVRAEYRL